MTSNENVKLDKKDLRKIFWRSFGMLGCWNYERQANIGFCYGITPAIEKLYHTKEDRRDALKRHLEFFACNSWLVSFILGIVAVMEEEKAANKDFDDKAISSVKVAMMGPLAGIGDSLLSNTWRILVTGLVASMALAGNLAAPIIFVVLLNIPHLLCRYYGLKLGYGLGVKFFSRVADSGIMEKVTWACSVVGIMVIGAMVSSIVYMSTPIIIGSGGEEGAVVLQEILDSILPSLMPLGLTGLLYWLLKKKVNVIVLVIGIMVLGIALSALGILA